MPVAFTISLPAESRFRELASEVARKYAELSGGSSADGDALGAAVAAEIESMASSDAGTIDARLVFAPTTTGVDVTVECRGRTALVTRPFPARKS